MGKLKQNLKRLQRSKKKKHPSSKKIGMAPGSLVYIGDKQQEEINISVVRYNEDKVEEFNGVDFKDLNNLISDEFITWVDFDGVFNIELLEKVRERFGIHPLVLEDIANTTQRPKVDEFEGLLYFVMKNIELDKEQNSINYEQISLILIDNIVLTFREKPGELFDPIIKRIQNPKSRFRKAKADYLTYAIMDTVIDQYFTFIDLLDDLFENLESELLTDPSPRLLHVIQDLKREMISVRKTVSPLREMISAVLRLETHLIEHSTMLFFRDVYDHAIRVMESMESYRDLASGMLDIYLSSVSNKMNEVMKVLTIFAAIFIPLTFIAGVYGMNFEYMPELQLKFAYPLIWVVFVVVTGGLIVYFKKKKWF